MNANFTIIDNSTTILSELQSKIDTALEAVGLQAEAHAKNNIKQTIPREHSSSTTGHLRNSITHIVKNDYNDNYHEVKKVIIGSNVPYAVFNEIGTGKWNSEGNGRQGWWVYVEGSSAYSPSRNVGKTYTEDEARRIMAILRSKGLEAHMTQGMKPVHFLKRAIEENKNEYRAMIEYYLKR